MTAEKYAKYMVKDVVAENKWGGQGISLSKIPDGLVPPKDKMTLGITAVTKPYMFHDITHKHTFTEYFYFFGSGPCMNDFEAEAEYSFGEQAEKQVINTPTIVVIPPMVYHCPLNYVRVTQPFYCLEAFLATNRTEIKLEDEKETVEIKTPELNYKRYFIKDVVAGNRWGGERIALNKVPSDLIPAGANINLAITIVKKPYLFHEPTHKHTFTEFCYFFGSNPLDMNDFDAEVELTFGEERQKYVISSPTIVAMPPGLFHGGLRFKRIGKPIYCLEAFLTSSYTGINLEAAKT